MAATQNAMYQLQPGASLAAAFPQVTPNGVGPQDLDLLQIVGKGGAILAKVDSTGAVSGGQSGAGAAFVLTQAAVSTLVLTQAAVNSFVLTSVVGATGVYTGTVTGGDANAFVGKTVVISGFATSGNNVTAVITGSSATTITVAVTTQADETHAGAALVVGVTQVTFTGTITGGGTNNFVGKSVLIAGFAAGSGANNGTFTILSNSITVIVALADATNVNETHAGTAQVAGVSQTTYTGTITGGGANALVGRTVSFSGFAASTGANNVSNATVVASTGSTLVVVTTTQVNETHAGTATLGTLSGTNSTRVGVFNTNLPPSSTLAQLFADAFSNPQQDDILQVINAGGNVSYFLNYQGVATGS